MRLEAALMDPDFDPWILAWAREFTRELGPAEMYPLADRGVLLRWPITGGTVEVEFDADHDVTVLISRPGDRQAGTADELWPEATRLIRAT